MRRWIALAAKLYPRKWRERYGPEFDALVEDVEADWQELANVLGGAVKMQVTNGLGYLKLATAMAVAGALAAAALSFREPVRYVATAAMRLTPDRAPDQASPDDEASGPFNFRLHSVTTEILSRGSLAEIMTHPAVDIYRDERQRVPMESVLLQMREDVRIVPQPQNPGNRGAAFTVSFAYRDKDKAQEVVERLVARFGVVTAAVNQNRVRMWESWGKDQARAGMTDVSKEPPPPGEFLDVLDPPHLERKPDGPNRLAYVAAGIGAGLLVTLVAMLGRLWPRQTLRVGACAAAGCGLAAAGSLLIPDRYTSTTVMWISPPLDAKRWYGDGRRVPAAERVRQLQQQVLSDARLEPIILEPKLNLYGKERASLPMRDVIEIMRTKDIAIQMVGAPPSSAVRISYTCSHPQQAQAVVRELVAQFSEVSLIEQRDRAKTATAEWRSMAEHRLGENLLLLEPATLPKAPLGPNRIAIAAAGFGLGLILGLLSLWIGPRHRPPLPLAAGA
jgi:hypothetical protein